jgi:hypothetical protein
MMSSPRVNLVRYRADFLKLLALVALALIINATLLLDIKGAFLWILAVLIVIQLIEPALSLILMLPVYFRMFGLLPRQYFEGLLGSVEPRDLAFLFLMALTVIACITKPRIFTRVRRSVLFFPILFLTGYVLLRMVLTAMEFGEPILALRTGRRYFSYLIYFAVIAFVSNRQKGRRLISGIIILGTIIALMNITAQVLPGWFASLYSTANLSDLYSYGGALGVKLHVLGRFLMFLALIWCFFRWLQFRRRGDVILLMVLGSGFLVQKYRTFYLALPFSVLLTWAVARKSRKTARRQLRLLVGFTVAAAMGLVLVLLASSGLREEVMRFVWEAWAGITGQISSGTFQDRLQRAAWRLDLFGQHPILGVGFIHDSLAPLLFDQESVGITWIGYADVLVTGGISLAIAIGWIVIASWRFLLRGLRKQVLSPDVFWIVAGALAFSLMSTLGMVSWSLLTIDDGIVPLVLALGLAERYLDFAAQNRSDESTSALSVAYGLKKS